MRWESWVIMGEMPKIRLPPNTGRLDPRAPRTPHYASNSLKYQQCQMSNVGIAGCQRTVLLLTHSQWPYQSTPKCHSNQGILTYSANHLNQADKGTNHEIAVVDHMSLFVSTCFNFWYSKAFVMNVVVHLATDNQMVIPVESGRSMQPRPRSWLLLGKIWCTLCI